MSSDSARGLVDTKGDGNVDPYVQTALVMCGIVFVALAATSYLAVTFNRRAKDDLRAALTPLAERIGGTVDLDRATISGRYGRTMVEARVTNAAEGPGRVFQIDVIDAAGGCDWVYTSSPPRREGADQRIEFASERADLRELLTSLQGDAVRTAAEPERERFRIEYHPDTGSIRLTRPMRTRRDIPDTATFERQLAFLVQLGDENRSVQRRVPEGECP